MSSYIASEKTPGTVLECSVWSSVLTKLWRARVELLRQKAVISEALHGVAHGDDRHHDQPAPQDVQEATHDFFLFFLNEYIFLFRPPAGEM